MILVCVLCYTAIHSTISLLIHLLLFYVFQNGFINSLSFSHSGDFLVAGVGQEHRFGRWWRNKTAKNSVAIIPLQKQSEAIVTAWYYINSVTEACKITNSHNIGVVENVKQDWEKTIAL